MPHNKFTATKVNALVARRKPGWHGDGGGLWLQTTKTGTGSWIFRYRAPADGRPRVMGLGPLHTVSLGEARDAAALARKAIFAGRDPIGARMVAAVTFDRCMQACLKDREANKLPTAGWLPILTRHALPALGAMSIAAITTDDVLRMLSPLWTTKTETANKLRRYTEAVLNHATHVKKLRGGENPAGWALLRHSLQSTKKVAPAKSYAAMVPEELPGFMRELAAIDDIGARALEVLILTVSRTGDIIGQPAKPNEDAKPPMRWVDVDLDSRIWTIPRDKMGNRFEVPLSDAVVAILCALPTIGGGDELVFGGMGKNCMWKLLKAMRPGLTVHGFRSTFSGWAKNGEHRRELVEATLKHQVHQNEVEKAYSQHVSYLPGRIRLMQLWAEYAAGAEVREVVQLRTPIAAALPVRQAAQLEHCV